MTTTLLTRRNALLTALFGTGLVGLRAMATGLPAWFIANPRRATAQDLECAIAAKDTLQYLIVSVASAGDPINCNCPGSYEALGPDPAAAIHPDSADMAAVQVQLGARTYGAAAPWAMTDVNSVRATGRFAAGLADQIRSRMAFFHHVTQANNHGDQPKVMRLMGATSKGEMLVSAYAKHLGPCFGTVQTEPVAVGAGGNASELVSFAGRSLPSVSPTQLRQLLTGSGGSTGGRSGGKGGTNVLQQLRTIRDNNLNRLNELAKQDGTNVQKQFLDALAASQTQVRKLAMDLQTTLGSINGDTVEGQALAAAALIAANVTPVVTMRIPFGGDNHTDGTLTNETNDHIDNNNRFSGVAGVMRVIQALTDMGLQDKVTFATLNVFGRNLNGIDKVMQKSGRDHYGNHSVALMIGKNVVPGVYGGVAPITSRGTTMALGATDIDSATGNAVLPGMGDIPSAQTPVAMARTLGAALGIPQSALDADFIQAAGGKVVPAAVTSVPA
jgi:hypothetical protein